MLHRIREKLKRFSTTAALLLALGFPVASPAATACGTAPEPSVARGCGMSGRACCCAAATPDLPGPATIAQESGADCDCVRQSSSGPDTQARVSPPVFAAPSPAPPAPVVPALQVRAGPALVPAASPPPLLPQGPARAPPAR